MMSTNLYHCLQNRLSVDDDSISLTSEKTALVLDKTTIEKLEKVDDLKLQVSILAGLLKPVIGGPSVLEDTLVGELYKQLTEYADDYIEDFSSDTSFIIASFNCGKLLEEASQDYFNCMRKRLKRDYSNLNLSWIDTSHMFKTVALCALLLQ